jgi:hypothetical protein
MELYLHPPHAIIIHGLVLNSTKEKLYILLYYTFYVHEAMGERQDLLRKQPPSETME